MSTSQTQTAKLPPAFVTKREEQLRDRRAYRDTLIYKRELIEAKIQTVEQQISALR